MIFSFKNLKSSKLQATSYKLNSGMSIVELLVVLSIFSAVSSVAIFNFGSFQGKVDVKNLATDIALRIVEAQKSSLSGVLPPLAQQTLIVNSTTWKPSYGVYFNPASDNKNFIYFTDLDNTTPAQNHIFDGTACTGECLSSVVITKGNYISRIDSYSGATPTQISNPLSITFKRPDSGAVFSSSGSVLTGFDYIQITISSPKAETALIKVYPSGRIQIN